MPMSPTQPLPPKKEVGLALLERSSVYVHLDPRQEAVVVPNWFKKQPQLVLQVGMNMPVPIPDLRFDDDGMSCTLSFNRAPFFCVIPWASVFAMVGDDGRGMVWPDDVPAEVAKQAQGRGPDAARKDLPKERVTTVPAVPVVREARDLREARDGKSEPTAKTKRRKRPSLSAVPDADDPVGSALKTPPGAGRASPVRPVVAPAPTPRPFAGPTRKKRELPPYLRVVK
jgi:stringent starvation protein B